MGNEDTFTWKVVGHVSLFTTKHTHIGQYICGYMLIIMDNLC